MGQHELHIHHIPTARKHWRNWSGWGWESWTTVQPTYSSSHTLWSNRDQCKLSSDLKAPRFPVACHLLDSSFIQRGLVIIPFCIKINNFNQLVLISQELKLKKKNPQKPQIFGTTKENVRLQPIKFQLTELSKVDPEIKTHRKEEKKYCRQNANSCPLKSLSSSRD